MSLAKWLVPALCASVSLVAQTLGDLNGLVASGAHYASHGMAGTHGQMPLEVCKLNGDSGTTPPTLMSRGVDVAHWTFLYRINQPAAASDAAAEAGDAAPKPHRSVTTQCSKGVFSDFKYSPSMVTGVKSMEYTWIGISLDEAIAQLNANGYVRGFSRVTLMRPDNPNYPEDFVYIFDCPWERTQVAISTQNGALTWRATY